MEDDNNEALLKECLAEVIDFEKRFKTSSIDQNPKVYEPLPKPSYDCEFLVSEDPDTPPVTAEVDDIRQKYRQVIGQLLESDCILYSYCTFGDTDTGDADPFANSIMTIFRAYGYHIRLLRRMIKREISITTDYTTVFRRNSMCTKMMTAFAKDTGQSYIMDILSIPCRQIFDAKNEIIEVEATLLKSKNIPVETIPENIKNLLARCQQILDSVLGSIEQCPGSFRYLCDMLQHYVKEKWPDGGDDPWVKAIAGFYFLRFLCPSIIAPEVYGLTAVPDADQRRKFVLIAKVIQNLANATSFAGQIKEWDPIDVWIKENSNRILKFFHALASRPNSFLPFIVTPVVTGLEIYKSLAVLQQMTRVKMTKIIKLLEHEYTRTSNLLEGDPKDIIRDIQSYLATLMKHDFYGITQKLDHGWYIEGLSQKLLSDTLKMEQYYKSSDGDVEFEKCMTLNWQPDPDDKLLKKIQRESKYKKKESEVEAAQKVSNTTKVESEDEIEDDKGQLAPLKLLNPNTLTLRLLADLIPLLKGPQTESKLKELRRSEKFRNFSLRAFRLQKCDVHALANSERKAFWLNIYHLLFLHAYILVGFPGRHSLHRLAFFSSFQYKIGNHVYCLSDIIELLRGVTTADEKYRYFERTDPRRNKGVNALDGRVFFAISNFNQSSPAFNIYYPESIEQQLDKAVEQVVNEMIETNMDIPAIILPKLFETHAEDLKIYVLKKYNQKATQGMEWVKPLLSVDISGGQGEVIIENCYTSLHKVTKSKPEVSVKPENWTPKIALDVQINLPPDDMDVEEEEKPKRPRMKVKFDDNGFPVVPWPDVKLDQMSREELIDYIRLCKRSLKQGATMYSTLLEKYERANTSLIT